MNFRSIGWKSRGLIVLGLFVGVMAYGQSAVLTISGVVYRTVSIDVKPQNNYNSLDLVSGEKDKLIAVINERSNSKTGYTVMVSSDGIGSQNRPVLRGLVTGNSEEIPYSLNFGGRAVHFNGGTAILSRGTKRTERFGIDNPLTVTISPVRSQVMNDTYADTLRFTIQAN
jgi:spore coat protein U-like protein